MLRGLARLSLHISPRSLDIASVLIVSTGTNLLATVMTSATSAWIFVGSICFMLSGITAAVLRSHSDRIALVHESELKRVREQFLEHRKNPDSVPPPAVKARSERMKEIVAESLRNPEFAKVGPLTAAAIVLFGFGALTTWQGSRHPASADPVDAAVRTEIASTDAQLRVLSARERDRDLASHRNFDRIETALARLEQDLANRSVPSKPGHK
jgi:hypothetical protein